MKIEQLCVCDEEMCWCTRRVEVEIPEGSTTAPDVACPECASGRHLWSPDRRGA